MNTDVLVVQGRVRRGTWYDDLDSKCEECGRDSHRALISSTGRITFVCDQCAITCGEPQPPMVGDLCFPTVAALRTAVAARTIPAGALDPQRNIWREVELYEVAIAKWQRMTRKHGFCHSDARPHHDRALWAPFSSDRPAKYTVLNQPKPKAKAKANSK